MAKRKIARDPTTQAIIDGARRKLAARAKEHARAQAAARQAHGDAEVARAVAEAEHLGYDPTVRNYQTPEKWKRFKEALARRDAKLLEKQRRAESERAGTVPLPESGWWPWDALVPPENARSGRPRKIAYDELIDRAIVRQAGKPRMFATALRTEIYIAEGLTESEALSRAKRGPGLLSDDQQKKFEALQTRAKRHKKE